MNENDMSTSVDIPVLKFVRVIRTIGKGGGEAVGRVVALGQCRSGSGKLIRE